MTSRHGNDFFITDPLSRWESTDRRWIPPKNGEKCGPLMFIFCQLEWNVQQRVDLPMIWCKMTFMWRHDTDIFIIIIIILLQIYLYRAKPFRQGCSTMVHDGVSNHQPYDCSLNRLFRRRSKKTSKLRVTGLCAGNSPVTGEFPAQRASNAENVSIWWLHHDWEIVGLSQL